MTHPIHESRGSKGNGALQLSTVIPLGADRREMEIRTYKQDTGGTIVCRVSVSQISECGAFRSHVIGFGKEGDFSCRHGVAKARATPKALHALHRAALNDVETLLAAAREHYAQKALQTAEPEPLAKAA
ncbi:hypothetical protein DBR42_21780 [Pelomonas sp. HMWF004]|nr:hypothetical protein DBR42_21780 [Pelomonas sp. HMWF004]